MSRCVHDTEEHELPSVEAVLAATLALMTGYSQALQAAVNPEQRLVMGARIGNNLGLLTDHPLLSSGFKTVLTKLQQRWMLMTACTAESAPDWVRAEAKARGTPLPGSRQLH